MAKVASKKFQQPELDSVYVLKVLIYILLGCIWISLNDHRVIPIGLLAGIGLAQHEKLRLDRKIEYAVLMVAALAGLIGYGITLVVRF